MPFGLLSRIRKRSPDDPPPTEAWPVHAFGKLPVYKDFISAGLTEDGAREMRDWLSSGFSRIWSEREECRGAEIPLHGFLLRLPESGRLVAGALWGSHDQGGLRKFPFLLFSVVPVGRGGSNLLTALDYLPVFEKRAREIRRRYASSGSLADVYAELRGARIELPMRPEDEVKARLGSSLSTKSVGTLAHALLGGEAVPLWSAFLSAVDSAPRRVGEEGTGACRIPLAGELPPVAQLQLWILRMAAASPRDPGPVGVLYRSDADAPAGVLFFRDLTEKDFLLLHPEAIPYEGVADLVARPVHGEPPEESVEPPTPAPLVEEKALPAPEPALAADEPTAEAAEPDEEALPAAPADGTDLEAVSLPAADTSPVPDAAPLLTEVGPAPEVLPEGTDASAPERTPSSTAAPVPDVIEVLGSAARADFREPAPPAEGPGPAPPPEPDGWEMPVSSLLEGV